MDFSYDTYMAEYYRNLITGQLAGGGSTVGGLFAGNMFPGYALTGWAVSPYACFTDALEKALEESRDIQEGEDVSDGTRENVKEMEQFLSKLRENMQKQYSYYSSGMGLSGSLETGSSSEPGQRESLASRLEKNRESRRQERIAGRYLEQSTAGKTAAENRTWRV